MIGNKGIKIFCYIMMGIVWTISGILLVFGVVRATDKNWYSLFFIALGLILPLVCSISLYPIFALANIDQNIYMLNKKVEEIATNNTTSKTEHNCAPYNNSKTNIVDCFESDTVSINAIHFVCKEYGVSVSLEDDIETIKEKISSIQNDSSKADIFKSKVIKAETKEEILRIFIMHKIAHD